MAGDEGSDFCIGTLEIRCFFFETNFVKVLIMFIGVRR
jgi:hypothetical protein